MSIFTKGLILSLGVWDSGIAPRGQDSQSRMRLGRVLDCEICPLGAILRNDV